MARDDDDAGPFVLTGDLRRNALASQLALVFLQPQVHEGQVEVLAVEKGVRFGERAGNLDEEVARWNGLCSFDALCKQLLPRWVVVDHENSMRYHVRDVLPIRWQTVSHPLVRNTSLNRVPTPRSLLTSMVPPKLSTWPLVHQRPRPCAGA